jgi:ribosomal-protein-serine acetyltransferase
MFRIPILPDFDLRLLEERHAATVFGVVDRERDSLRQWLPWVDSTSAEDDTLTFIRGSLEQFASNSGFTAGIWNGNTFSGVIGTHKIDWLNRRVEVGYWLAQSFRGKGIMTEACRAVVTHALGELDLHRVEILCAAGNAKSAAIPRRLGFTFEGILRERQRLNGQFHDMLLFSMLQRDWKA